MQTATAHKTWKPTVAGILDLLAALIASGLLIGTIIFAIISPSLMSDYAHGLGSVFYTILIIWLIYLAVMTTLCLLGGIYALKRRRWGWALAGSIASLFCISILGIVPIVSTAVSKDEFE